MKLRSLLVVLTLLTTSALPTHADDRVPKVAVAYDIGFLGDNSFNDAVNVALTRAKKNYKLAEPFVREVPTNGTAVDRLTRLRFLAKSGYTLIIAVGPGYRETVRRVSMEYPDVQFAIINDRSLNQMNISNIYFNENDGAYLAGVAAASNSKRESIGFVGSETELFTSFAKGARATRKGIKVVNIPYPDEISALMAALKKVDIIYSTWDGDASVISTVLDWYAKKVRVIAEIPDQYFASVPGAQQVLLATIKKDLTRPVDQLVAAALENRAIIDVIDESNGIYGREFNVRNSGITLGFVARAALTGPVRSAVSAIRAGKVSTTP